MGRWSADKFWQWGMGLALPVAIGSACLDRSLIETVMALWDDPTPTRLTFFLSSTLLLIGFARNSARLRTMTEGRAASAPARLTAGETPSRAARFEPCND